MKASQRYRQMAQDMTAFRDAYLEVIDLTVPKRDLMMEVREPKPGKEPQLSVAKAKAGRLAGRAKQAQKESGAAASFVVLQSQMRVDPVTGWEYSLRDGDAMPPDALVVQLEQMAGALESKADDAEYNERSLAGRVAEFVGFPVRVRALVAEQHPGLAKAALATGIAAQVFAGVMATLIAALISLGVGALWKYATADPKPHTPPRVTTPTPVPTRSAPSVPTPSHT